MRPSPFIACIAAAAASLAALSAGEPAGAAPQPGPGPSIPASVIAASAAPGHHWSAGAERYAVGKTLDLPVTMADGTVLRADVYYPTDPRTKHRAAGRFPVVLTQSPYGKGMA